MKEFPTTKKVIDTLETKFWILQQNYNKLLVENNMCKQDYSELLTNRDQTLNSNKDFVKR